MSKTQNQPETATATIATKTSIPPWGGLPVKEIEPEVVVASVEITDDDEPQPVAVVKVEEEPKAKRRRSRRSAPPDAPQGAPDAASASSTQTSKKKAATPTAPEKAATARPAKASASKAKTARGKETKDKATSKTLDKSATFGELAVAFIAHLESVGKSHGTLASYAIELKLARAVLGEDTRVGDLTEKHIRAFFLSDRVTLKRSGQRKAEVGILKTRRVARMALEWAQEIGLVAKAPVPDLKGETTKTEGK
ncbi:MAG: hypothetical protein JXA90_13545 [Planctomycetes bacterium]|nr:hypothetical protein [Planctomycetota bacterium]